MPKAKQQQETETVKETVNLNQPGAAETFVYPTAKRKRSLTPEFISLAHREHIRIEVLAPIEEMHMPNFARSESGNVPVLKVRDLDNGEESYLIVTTVLGSVLERTENYVGMKLEIVSAPPREGKNYRDVRVWEIE